MSTLTYTDTLVIVECYLCHMTFAMPRFKQRQCEDNGDSFHCPNGHSQVYVESKVQRLEREKRQLADKLARQVSITDQYSASLDHAHEAHARTRRQLSGTKAVVTRYKKKIVAGRCVCCSHQFKDLERHMKNQHPDWNPDRHAEALAERSGI